MGLKAWTTHEAQVRGQRSIPEGSSNHKFGPPTKPRPKIKLRPFLHLMHGLAVADLVEIVSDVRLRVDTRRAVRRTGAHFGQNRRAQTIPENLDVRLVALDLNGGMVKFHNFSHFNTEFNLQNLQLQKFDVFHIAMKNLKKSTAEVILM